MISGHLNIVLVGAAGNVAAPAHLYSLAAIPNANLYGVCDLDKSNMVRLAKQFETRAFPSLDDALADPNVQAVDLVTPPFVHTEQAVAAAQSGRHVYCEKPMTRSLAEADAMIDAHRIAGTTLMVGESYVFHHPNVAAKAVIERGEIGDILHIRETKAPWLMRGEETGRLDGLSHEESATWRVDPRLSGGGRFPWIMDHAPHFFAVARYFAGQTQVTSVTSHTQGTLPVVDDVLRSTATPRQTIDAVAWSFDNGIDSTWHQVDSNPIEISDLGFSTVIHGTEGKLIAYGEGGGSAPGMNQPPAVVLYRDGKMQIIDEVNSDDRVWVSNNNYYYAAHQTALQHWVNSILLDKQVRYSGVDGRMELAATLAAIKSALEQRTLAPADVSANWTAY